MMILFGSSYDTSDGSGAGHNGHRDESHSNDRRSSSSRRFDHAQMRRALRRNGIEVTSFKGSVSCRGAGVAVNQADHDFGPHYVFSASASGPHPAFHR